MEYEKCEKCKWWSDMPQQNQCYHAFTTSSLYCKRFVSSRQHMEDIDQRPANKYARRDRKLLKKLRETL